jgi:hypothetical protein
MNCSYLHKRKAERVVHAASTHEYEAGLGFPSPILFGWRSGVNATLRNLLLAAFVVFPSAVHNSRLRTRVFC